MQSIKQVGYMGALFIVGCALITLFSANIYSGDTSDKRKALSITEAPKRLMAQVRHDRLKLNASEGNVYHGDTLFSGYAMKYYNNGKVAEKIAFRNGKREGLTQRWYPEGMLSFQGTYVQNRRHGSIQSWWKDGTLRSIANYVDGVPHGVQKQWYQSGALFKEIHLDQGKESGLQRAWRENGKLYANYEAKNGRIFGLKRANLCFDLDDEAVQIGDS